jgi:hypothetical protein
MPATTTKLTATQELIVSTFERFDWRIDIDVDGGVLSLTASHEAWPARKVSGTVGKRGAIKLADSRETLGSFYEVESYARCWSKR